MEKELNDSSNSNYLLVEFPIDPSSDRKKTRSKLKSNLRVALHQGIKDGDRVSSNPHYREGIVTEAVQSLSSQLELGKGVSVTVDLANYGSGEGKVKVNYLDYEPREIAEIRSKSVPHERFKIGQNYNRFLGIVIDKYTTKTYDIDLAKNSVNELNSVRNPTVIDVLNDDNNTKRGIKIFSPSISSTQSIFSGTYPLNEHEREVEDEKRYVFSGITNSFKDNLAIDEAKGVVIKLSESLKLTESEYREWFDDIINKDLLTYIKKENLDEDSVAENLLRTSHEIKENHIMSDIFDAKDEEQFSSGWYEVCKSARANRIEKLYLDSKSDRGGYILDSKYPFTYAVKGSSKSDSIAPYLMKLVRDSGGVVINLDDLKHVPNFKVAAKLRY